MRVVYVGGISGAGKSTSSKGIVESYPDFLMYISSGEIKRPESRRRFGKSLSNLNQAETFEINSYLFDQLNESEEKVFLLDSHFTYPVLPYRGKFVKLIPRDLINCLDILCLFQTHSKEVVQRRISRGRENDSIKIDFVKKESEEERREAEFIHDSYGIPLEIINTNVSIETVVNTFSCVLINYGLLKSNH